MVRTESIKIRTENHSVKTSIMFTYLLFYDKSELIIPSLESARV